MTMMLYKKVALIVVAFIVFAGATAAAFAAKRMSDSQKSAVLRASVAVAKNVQANQQPQPGGPPDMNARLSRMLPTVEFDAVGVRDVFSFLHDVSGADFAVDWDALAGAGIKPDAPVSVDVRSVPLSGALRLVLWSVAEPGVLDYQAKQGTLLISTSAALSLPPPKADSSVNEDTKRFLQQTMSQFPLDKKPVAGVLNDLSRVQRLPLWVRWKDLQHAGVERDTPISLQAAKLTSVSGRLDSILAATGAKEPLGYAIVDGLVIVTTADTAKKMERLGQVDHMK